MNAPNDAAKKQTGNDRGGGLGFVHGNAKIEIVADEQRQGAFKTTEANVARKKIRISKTDVRLGERVAPLGKCGRRVAWPEPGFKLSARMKNARRKFAAQSAAAVQPGPVAPKKCRAMPLIAGPKINPNPNAMPMSPIRLIGFPAA